MNNSSIPAPIEITPVASPDRGALPPCFLVVPRPTTEMETGILCWKARQTSGDLLELGCHTGITTAELAINCFPRRVFAVDYLGPDLTVRGEQEREVPSVDEVCKFARHLPNVVLRIERSETIDLNDFNLGFVFIDGDHSYEGVSKDSEPIFEYFRNGFGSRPAAVFWHDYLEAPWCGVKRYLDECTGRYPLRRFQGTNLVCWEPE